MNKERPKEFYYTNEQMVKDLLAITPISGSVLDAGSGENKVWFNNLKGEKYECEIEDGCDFYEWNKKVDWIVGNPPFHESWKFFEKSLEIARKGIAFLINNQALNSWTPKRYQRFVDKGFYLQKIHIVLDKRWFGRYYYLIFTKEPNNFISWNTKTYDQRRTNKKKIIKIANQFAADGCILPLKIAIEDLFKEKKPLKQRILEEMVILPIKRKSKEKLGDLIFNLVVLICEGYKGDDDAFKEAEEIKEKINNLTPNKLWIKKK